MGLYKISLLLLIISYAFSSSLFAADVSMFVFNGDEPANKVRIQIKDKVFTTDESGILETKLEVGVHEALIYSNDSDFETIQLNVKNNEPLFVNYTILSKAEVYQWSSKKDNSDYENIKKASTFSGVVSHYNSKLPINEVRVLVHGLDQEVITGKDGKFSFKLPSGKFSISFMHSKFSTLTLNNLSFSEDQKTVESVSLKPSGLELDEYVVLSPTLKSSVNALLEVRKGHQTVADLIGSEQISKSGDSDAGSSLRRVTGLSLVDGKYIYVRGLGERYSSTKLNNSMIPSPDPSRRVVSLDLFPASVIENMTIQKGYSPEMSAEFGGGSIEIKTKSLPEKAYGKFSISQNFESVGPVQTYNGGNRDWQGLDNGDRKIPFLLENYINSKTDISALDPNERKKLAASINKSYQTRDVTSDDRSKLPNFSLSAGNKHRLGKVKFGYNISSLYSNKWSFNSTQNANFNQTGTGLVEDSGSIADNSKNIVKLAGLLGVGVEYKRNKVSYNGSLLRKTKDFVKVSNGSNSENVIYRKTELGWSEKSVTNHQLSGEHKIRSLNNSKINWSYSKSRALLYEPDNKMYNYIKVGDSYELETENGSAGNSVSWKHMPDDLQNTTLDYSQPIEVTFLDDVVLDVGINNMNRSREFVSRTFYFKFDDSENTKSGEKQSTNPDDVFSDKDAELYQQSNNTDNYSATQSINAYYTNLKIKNGSFDITAGYRFENSIQKVESYKLFNAGKTYSELETRDYLPAISATYRITNKMQIRANVSESISRPDLREISKTIWNDTERGAKYEGNPNLKSAEIQNMGVRYEWYFNRGEVVSVGYFQKKFKRPIEEIFGALSDDGRVVGTTETQYTFLNIDEANNQGVEFEFRKRLTNNLVLGGNYSWIESKVEIAKERAGQLTSLNRPLQGQSPYLMNIQLDYEPKTWKSTFSLLYNEMGRRITGVGADKRPDEYQEQISTLDFVASTSLYDSWKLKFKAKNLLDPKVTKTQGSKITQSTRKGQQYYLGLNKRF